MKIKIHQYKEEFIRDLSFWMETEVNGMFETSWMNHREKCKSSEESGLLSDYDSNTRFYYNKELNEN